MTAPRELPCPDCGGPMRFKHEPPRKPKYYCLRISCGGNHGAHPDGRPLGHPADHETRQARIRAHQAIDQLVDERYFTTQRAAYRWMRKAMGLSSSQAHIGKFTVAQCELLVALTGDLEDERATRRRRSA